MPDDEDKRRLLKLSEVAERLSASEREVQRMIDDGRLPSVKFGRRMVRVAEADLEAFIEAHRRGA